ncbi:MAG: hypothetical protein H6807_13915 [Planctomycetes bacterium]|nr:hypothetical protein [Planctomycetota bacterium]
MSESEHAFAGYRLSLEAALDRRALQERLLEGADFIAELTKAACEDWLAGLCEFLLEGKGFDKLNCLKEARGEEELPYEELHGRAVDLVQLVVDRLGALKVKVSSTTLEPLVRELAWRLGRSLDLPRDFIIPAFTRWVSKSEDFVPGVAVYGRQVGSKLTPDERAKILRVVVTENGEAAPAAVRWLAIGCSPSFFSGLIDEILDWFRSLWDSDPEPQKTAKVQEIEKLLDRANSSGATLPADVERDAAEGAKRCLLACRLLESSEHDDLVVQCTLLTTAMEMQARAFVDPGLSGPAQRFARSLGLRQVALLAQGRELRGDVRRSGFFGALKLRKNMPRILASHLHTAARVRDLAHHETHSLRKTDLDDVWGMIFDEGPQAVRIISELAKLPGCRVLK